MTPARAADGRRGRILAVALVVAVLVGAGVADRTVRVRAGAVPAPPADSAVAPAGASTSSWFCAGGGNGPGYPATPMLFFANSTGRTVRGTALVSVSSQVSATTAARTVSVGPHRVAAFRPASLEGGPGAIGTTVTFAGGGVAVSEALADPQGWSMVPCASSVAASWYFTGESTVDGSDATLELYNPTASAAVTNVTFDTPAGVIDPSQYQGVILPPFGVVTEHLGDFVQQQPLITTIVSVSSGAVVAAEVQSRSSAAGGGRSVVLGMSTPSTAWSVPGTVDAPGATVGFTLANISGSPVAATLTFGSALVTSVPSQVQIPANGVVSFAASSSPRVPARTPYLLTVSGSGPLLVARTVGAAGGGQQPVWGDSTAMPSAARGWLLAGPGSPGHPVVAGATFDTVSIGDPGPVGASVTVRDLAGTVLAREHVQAGTVAVLPQRVVGGQATYVVSASEPVVVAGDLVPAGAPGVVSVPGFPLSAG